VGDWHAAMGGPDRQLTPPMGRNWGTKRYPCRPTANISPSISQGWVGFAESLPARPRRSCHRGNQLSPSLRVSLQDRHPALFGAESCLASTPRPGREPGARAATAPAIVRRRSPGPARGARLNSSLVDDVVCQRGLGRRRWNFRERCREDWMEATSAMRHSKSPAAGARRLACHQGGIDARIL